MREEQTKEGERCMFWQHPLIWVEMLNNIQDIYTKPSAWTAKILNYTR